MITLRVDRTQPFPYRTALFGIVGELGPDPEEADRAAWREHGKGRLGGSFERGGPPLAAIRWPGAG
jgi:hypothetical protein